MKKYREYPLVSIITPTYNNFDHLRETIASVYSQTYPNIEYLITDDGSADFSEEAITREMAVQKNKLKRTRIIHHKDNIGTVRNLNNVLKDAKGDYIVYLSCGDVFFDKSVIERIIDRFLNTKSDVLVTSRVLYSNDFSPVCLLPHYEEREIINGFTTGIDQYKAFIKGQFYDMASGSAMCVTRDILEKMGYYDEEYYLWEDGPFLAKYLQIGKIEFAYDIVEIWYERGGVSAPDKHRRKSGEKSITNAKMREDMIHFIQNEKMERMDLFSFRERRMIQYRNKRTLYDGRCVRYFLYILYFPEFLHFTIYTIKRKSRCKRDQIEINRLLKSSY